jgi:hypothetical protein
MSKRSLKQMAAVGLSICLCAGPVSALTAGLQKVYGTPQDVFNAAKNAAAKKDWKTVTSCITDNSLDMLAGGMVMLSGFMQGFAAMGAQNSPQAAQQKAMTAKLAAINKRHGLTDAALKKSNAKMGEMMQKGFQQAQRSAKPTPAEQKQEQNAMMKSMREISAPIKDRKGYLVEVLTLMSSDPRGGFKTSLSAGSTLTGVKINGAKASGTTINTINGITTKEPIEFVKVGGGWKVELPMGAPGRVMTGGPSPAHPGH